MPVCGSGRCVTSTPQPEIGDDAGGTAGACARLSPREPGGLGGREARAGAPRLSVCGAREAVPGNSSASWQVGVCPLRSGTGTGPQVKGANPLDFFCEQRAF